MSLKEEHTMEFSGDWYSHYRYPSSGSGDNFWGQHLLRATQDGNRLIIQNGVDSPSHVVIELELRLDEQIAIGTWRERTDSGGHYKGAMYQGTIELKIVENGTRMSGIWHGTGKDGSMNSDIWELTKITTPGQFGQLPERWKMTYWYPSNDHDGDEPDEYEMKSVLHENTLILESLPKDDGSYMFARINLQDEVATGNWYESTAPKGEYKGAQYSGSGQLLFDSKTNKMDGLWTGAGYNRELKKMQIYTGKWEIVPINES